MLCKKPASPSTTSDGSLGSSTSRPVREMFSRKKHVPHSFLARLEDQFLPSGASCPLITLPLAITWSDSLDLPAQLVFHPTPSPHPGVIRGLENHGGQPIRPPMEYRAKFTDGMGPHTPHVHFTFRRIVLAVPSDPLDEHCKGPLHGVI